MLIPYLDIVYATWFLNHLGLIESGGDKVRMCGLRPAFALSRRCGITACEVKKVPRTFTSNIKSKRLAAVFSVGVKLMALALLIRISRPPNCVAALFTAATIASSSRISHWIGRAVPPAASISFAAEKIVPGNFGFSSAVFAAIAMLAPSAAARSAIASPIPREPPVMNILFPASDISTPLIFSQEIS